MVTREDPIDWSIDLVDSLWFHIGQYLTIDDLHRLTRTCSRLHHLLNSKHFWSYRIRQEFGSMIWSRFVKNTVDSSQSKQIYLQLIKEHRLSLSNLSRLSVDQNRIYRLINERTSLTGQIVSINDSIEFCYSLRIEIIFEKMLPGKYEVIWRMKLDVPYMLGVTEYLAVAEQNQSGAIAYTQWSQDDFLFMYQCFNCDQTKTNLWFYQSMGIVEIIGDHSCNVNVSMINDDHLHAKRGVYLDYVELKRRFDLND